MLKAKALKDCARLWSVTALMAMVLATSGIVGHVHATARTPSDLPSPCRGSDLFARLERTNPDAHAAIVSEAAKIPNDGAVLWQITPPARANESSAHPSFLFGTIHVTDPRVLDLPVAARAALESADTVALEIVDISPDNVNSAIAALGPNLFFGGDRNLTDFLGVEEQDALADVLETQGLPAEFATRFKPWFLSAMLALPACERRRTDAGAIALDIALEQRAKALGIRTVGLETLVSQFEVMASLPLAAQLSWLRASIALHHAAEDDLETLVQMYLRRRVATIWAFNRERLRNDPELTAGIADFQLAMIDRRNREMVASMRPLLDAGRAFVAVGALHLPGETGLVALLRQAGFRVSPVE